MSMKGQSLALYGGGKMGIAMLQGWLKNGLNAADVAVFDPQPSAAIQDLNVRINPDSFTPDIVVFAVKPQILPDLLEQLSIPKEAIVISVAAGCKIELFERFFGENQPIVRTMPNTPSAVGAGITALIGNRAVNIKSLELAQTLMGAVGETVFLEDEGQMDAVTGLSGSGPAYVFYMIECMTKAGIANGLSLEVSKKLALATVAGAGKLANGSQEEPSQLRTNVTSPGGTTAAGLARLMDLEKGLEPLILQTVSAACERSKMLGS